MRGKLGDRIRLMHILDAIGEIENYLIDTDFKKFIEPWAGAEAACPTLRAEASSADGVPISKPFTLKSNRWLRPSPQ